MHLILHAWTVLRLMLFLLANSLLHNGGYILKVVRDNTGRE